MLGYMSVHALTGKVCPWLAIQEMSRDSYATLFAEHSRYLR